MQDAPDAVPAARRKLLFWSCCVPVRCAVAAAALVVGYLFPEWLRLLSIYTAATALGFLYNAFLTLAGAKRFGGFGGRVWWAEMRWLHVALWTGTSALALAGVRWAGALLCADVVAGAMAAAYLQ